MENKKYFQEILRFGDVFPRALAHFNTTSAIEVGPFLIPKHCTVYANLSCLMKSEKAWPRAWQFKPERHIDAQGYLKEEPRFVPFGVGPRRCPGEQFVSDLVFLYFVRLVQKYEFLPVLNGMLPSAESEGDFVKRPRSFKIKVKSVS